MKVVVIGGTGHVGTYLVPRLIAEGHEVVSISRQTRRPYRDDAAWKQVQQVALDRAAEEATGTFGVKVQELEPDVVIDMICFTLDSARQMVDALQGRVQHFLHCGSIWVHGPSVQVPTTEQQPRRPFGEYGVQKAAIEAYLLDRARRYDFPATILHPGHIVGPGWVPVNPTGNFNVAVFERLAKGEVVILPNLGMETLHHVHADDVAGAFVQAMHFRGSALGENFHIVSEAALTLRGYAESVAGWFGQSVKLQFLPWERWRNSVSQTDARSTWDHIAHSPNCSIRKAQRLLDYQPRYTSLQAIQESVQWLREQGQISV